MEKKSNFKIFQEIDTLQARGTLPEKYAKILTTFIEGYRTALGPEAFLHHQPLFETFLQLVAKQCAHPFLFQPYHHRIRAPFDYYQFGIDMLTPLVDRSHSTLLGADHLQEMQHFLHRGDNVILLANHQTEADPHAISILLETTAPRFAEELIFVAGERVITDPLAIPFSMGRNLLCIYSKRYINLPPEEKSTKQLHNQRTMELMSQLLSEGGKAIYVAPSGGRDRPNAQGIVEVAPFDPSSIEMFYLMALRADRPTHFYPLALKTYALVPPPETIQRELGEIRLARRAQIHLNFGAEIDMENYPGRLCKLKPERRQARAHHIHQLVSQGYAQLP